ncbi:MAG: hypothetical protein ACOC1P_03340 [Minisyncoccales bacterium]
MVKKKKLSKNNLIVIAFILLAIASAIIFNFPEKDSERVYCQPEDREGDVCTQQYDPVCGFNSQGENETYSNSCHACLDSDVEYYVPGECKNENKR